MSGAEPNWNFAEAVYQLGSGELSDRLALAHGGLRLDFRQLKRRSCGIARWLREQGAARGTHVGHYLRNSNAYMETFVATGLIGATHVSVNYRYREKELIDLCSSLDIRVLVYDGEFAELVTAVVDGLAEPLILIQVGEGGVEVPGATQISELYEYDDGSFERTTSGDDYIIMTTGGTTGLPKGVMWRHEDLWYRLGASTELALKKLGLPEHPQTLDEHFANVKTRGVVPPFMPLSPLMHGTGLFTALGSIAQGTGLVTMPGVRFDADSTLDAIKEFGVASLTLVGDAFAVPILETLDRRREENLLASLKLMISSGAALSQACRDGLLEHQPKLALVDTLGSSESMSMAVSTPEAGVFKPYPTTLVLDEDRNVVEPGSDTIGFIYVTGRIPSGYYNEPEKSAETFPVIDGTRYVNSGDRCQVREDGMLILLGRDSTVINTGGEKVYTVEVERVLTGHPSISDALVVGLPHPQFGKSVAAVVQGPGLTQQNLDRVGVLAHAGEYLAGYKLPRQIYVIDDLRRAANGKPDYPFVTQFAEQQFAAGIE